MKTKKKNLKIKINKIMLNNQTMKKKINKILQNKIKILKQ